jgi:hypothetical protein
MKILQKILSYYWNICLLRESPENTPYSVVLLVIAVLLLTLIMTVQWSFSNFDFSKDLLLVFFAGLSLVVSFIVYTVIILFFKGLSNRIVQTTTSLLYAHSIVHVLAIPLFIVDPYLNTSNLKNPFFLFIGVLYLFVTLGLSVWQFVITAHVYKYALTTTPIQSVFAAFGLIAVNVLTLSFWR